MKSSILITGSGAFKIVTGGSVAFESRMGGMYCCVGPVRGCDIVVVKEGCEEAGPPVLLRLMISFVASKSSGSSQGLLTLRFRSLVYKWFWTFDHSWGWETREKKFFFFF